MGKSTSQRKREQRRKKKDKAAAAAAAAESYDKLKFDYENLLKENLRLKNENNAAAAQSRFSTGVVAYNPLITSTGVVAFDPQLCPKSKSVYDLNPELCPRFPQQRETLSLDAGFAQTPTLENILRNQNFIACPAEINIEIEYCLEQEDPSTTSFNNKDLGVVSSKIAPSVVSVSSFFGSERKIDCSGLVIHWSSSEKEATVLTSAKLLYSPKDSETEFHLIVRMADGTLLLAKEEHVDYYYNLLTLRVKPIVEPEVVDLRSRQADVVDGMKVISLGRSFYTSALYDTIGKLYEDPPNFGCGELLTSDCGIRKIGEGGPLVTDAGYVVGINFFGDTRCAHPLPTPTILSCLEMWKSFSTILRPWFGIRVTDVNQLCKILSIPVKKVTVSNRDLYVFVKEVYEGSVAQKNNIRPHASIATLDGTRMESVKQYSQILSEASRAATAGDSGHRVTVDDIIIEADYISVDDKRFSSCWPQVKVYDWLRP